MSRLVPLLCPNLTPWWRGGTAIALLALLSSCAGTPWGERFQRSLEPDPNVAANLPFGGEDEPTAPTLPATVPLYPNAVAETVPIDLVLPNEPFGTLTYWRTTDTAAQVEAFYREQLATNGWQFGEVQTLTDTAVGDLTTLAARRPELDVIVTLLPPTAAAPGDTTSPTPEPEATATPASPSPETAAPDTPTPETPTFFAIQFQAIAASTDAAPDPDLTNPSPSPSPSPTTGTPGFTLPTPGDRPTPGQGPANAPGLTDVPTALRPYVQDLLALAVLDLPNEGPLQPNQPITRRTFARWLVAVNNRYYADQPGQQIRLAIASAAPLFQDVPTSDPDFGPIQGLAEAGLIPSRLTGSAIAVNFRPDAPLTRADLLAWKVPLDTRQALPNATVEAVTQAWGFQDVAQLEAITLKAVLADRQAGEFSNIQRAFGYTTLLQPSKPVTQAEAAAVLWRLGTVTEGITAAALLAQPATPEN